MKIASQTQPKRARIAGFTVVEMVICSGIFAALIIAVTEMQIFGLQVYTLAATKLTATAGGRKAMNMIRDQVREAKIVDVGFYTNATSSFYFITGGKPQAGNALLIFPTTNTTYGTVFFMNHTTTPTDTNLCLCSIYMTNAWLNTNGLTFTVTNNSPGAYGLATNVLYITNYLAFNTEDFQGNTLTNNKNNRIIHMTLQFSQWEYPVAAVGSAAMYDYYQLHTKVTRRTTD